MKVAMTFMVVAAIAVIPAQAEVVRVEVTGFVEYNQVNFGIFADVNANDPVTLYFEVETSTLGVSMPTSSTPRSARCSTRAGSSPAKSSFQCSGSG